MYHYWKREESPEMKLLVSHKWQCIYRDELHLKNITYFKKSNLLTFIVKSLQKMLRNKHIEPTLLNLRIYQMCPIHIYVQTTKNNSAEFIKYLNKKVSEVHQQETSLPGQNILSDIQLPAINKAPTR